MIYLFCIIIPYLLGRGALRALYGRTGNQDIGGADSVLTGGMILIGLAEAAHVGAVVLGRSFSDCVKLFLVGLVILLIVAGILIVVAGRGKKNDKLVVREEKSLLFFVFAVIVLIQILLMVTEQKRYLTGDMTVEMVNSMLTTDTIYQVNPMTGQPYTLGMPMRLKILCLPTLHAILCHVFGVSATQVVWGIIPVFTLLGSYLAFYTVAKVLFREDTRKREIFMLFVALILWVGDYMYGMDGFGVQYAGFRGVSIRMAILMPYTLGLILRKKWKLVILCVLAEACIVWTLYGVGACLFVTLGMTLPGLIGERLVKNRKQQGGKGDSE